MQSTYMWFICVYTTVCIHFAYLDSWRVLFKTPFEGIWIYSFVYSKCFFMNIILYTLYVYIVYTCSSCTTDNYYSVCVHVCVECEAGRRLNRRDNILWTESCIWVCTCTCTCTVHVYCVHVCTCKCSACTLIFVYVHVYIRCMDVYMYINVSVNLLLHWLFQVYW